MKTKSFRNNKIKYSNKKKSRFTSNLIKWGQEKKDSDLLSEWKNCIMKKNESSINIYVWYAESKQNIIQY